LKEGALDRTLERTLARRGGGLVARDNTVN